ncbi:MAG: cation-translocating P-type ATPase [Kouleothrix sp.]|nr:cation-translocating P-type ATPase [Kouleothrix sp.]
MQPWYQLEPSTVLDQHGADAAHGLSAAEAARRLVQHGPNELAERGSTSPWRIVWEQLTAVMVIILIVAAVLSAALGDYKDTIVILAIVVLNAILGFTQEYRAEQAMAALKKLAAPIVKVRRDGHVQELGAGNLVPGDIVLLEAGNLAPADGRILESANLRIQEAALTGESEPVDKVVPALGGEDLPLGDRHNMAYMGTVVTYGRGQMVVTDTGMRTELGAIAAMLQTMRQAPTPLQRRLDQLGRTLAIIALAIVGVIFAIGLLRGEELQLMFLTAVSMAVAAVPEGLPAVVTIALALGAQRMLRRRALIRKLAAVETLGSVTVICSDKTGTLTENRMTVTALDVAGERVTMADLLAAAAPAQARAPHSLPSSQPTLALLLAGGALCNDALIEPDSTAPGGERIVGDPTEGALVVAAARLGLAKADLEAALPRVAEAPFDSARKRMTTIHRSRDQGPGTKGQGALQQEGHGGQADHLGPLAALAGGPSSLVGDAPYIAFTKGAVGSLLAVSSAVWLDARITPITALARTQIVAANDQLAQAGMRVLGVAFRPLDDLPPGAAAEGVEHDLVFVGMLGMIDPARAEVKDAVQTCQTAGIRPVMITGDHPLTARAIARELGIADGSRVLTGPELDRLSATELKDVVDEVPVYARVSPAHKLRIVQALQAKGHIVAMTGDGVNDAPALKQADIGVAMGITGTDVTKAAADMVLQDDNFATIVAAVAEGRVIFDNIRKFIKYLMTTNAGELWVMLLAPLFGMPLALLPLQILWVNLVTDGLPALALSLEPAERNTMRRAPYPPNEHIFARGMGRHILWVGLLMGGVVLGVGYGYWRAGLAQWQTMVFLTVTLAQMAHILAIRSERDSLFRIGLWSNTPLLGAVALTFVLQLALVYIPFLQGFFTTVALSAADLAIGLAASSLIFWAVEIEKWLLRRRATIAGQAPLASAKG